MIVATDVVFVTQEEIEKCLSFTGDNPPTPDDLYKDECLRLVWTLYKRGPAKFELKVGGGSGPSELSEWPKSMWSKK